MKRILMKLKGEHMELKIGLRNIKTAISVCICIFIARLLKLEYPFYSAIAAVITLGNSMIGSYRTGKNRLLGTLAGAVIGITFASIQSNNLLLCGIGIVLVIFLCNALKWRGSVTIGCVVFLAIMINLNGRSPIEYGIYRTIETFIGVITALLVNYYLFPHNTEDKLDAGTVKLAETIRQHIDGIICRTEDINLPKLNAEIAGLHEMMNVCAMENQFRKRDAGRLAVTQQRLTACSEAYEHLDMIREIGIHRTLNEANQLELLRLGFICSTGKFNDVEELDIVYNYHVGKILNQIAKLEGVL